MEPNSRGGVGQLCLRLDLGLEPIGSLEKFNRPCLGPENFNQSRPGSEILGFDGLYLEL